MQELAISFLIMLSPFAQFLYLGSIIDELDFRTFAIVYAKASGMSLCIYIVFCLAGQRVFENVFHINMGAFKIFGGIIIFSYAYMFLMAGAKTVLRLKENLDDLASEIALPFIVGAGTIYLSILIGHNSEYKIEGIAVIAGLLLLNYMIVIGLSLIKHQFKKKRQVAFDKIMGIAMRLNGFFMGAIGVQMVLEGLYLFLEKLPG